MGPYPYHLHWAAPKANKERLYRAIFFGTSQAPFSRWYNAKVWCDHHARNPDRSTKNCNALKREVQSLIKDGKLKFEESDRPVEDLFKARVEIIRKEEKALRGAGSGKVAIPRDEVSITKDKRSEAKGSSTTERSKERLCKLNWEGENKTFYHMIRELEQMLKEQKEYFATLRRRTVSKLRGRASFGDWWCVD